MTTEQLLIPRYEVIADYPKSLYHVGDILNAGWRSEDLIYCDHNGPRWRDYPHLFRKLHWWEKRKIEDMPEYIKLPNGKVWKIEKYDFEDNTIYSHGGCKNTLTMFLGVSTPATETEYITYINGMK